MSCEKCKNTLLPKNANGTTYATCTECKRDLSVEASKIDSKRSLKQNAAMHVYFREVAEALDREGHSMQDVLKAAKKVDIRPTENAVKEVIWKPIQEVMLGKESTTDLEKSEVDKVYEVMNRWLGEHFHIHVPFPTTEVSTLGEDSILN